MKRVRQGVDICTNLEKANGKMYSGDSKRDSESTSHQKGLFVLWQEKETKEYVKRKENKCA